MFLILQLSLFSILYQKPLRNRQNSNMNNEESTETHRLETVESDQPNLDDIDLDLEGLKDLKSKNFITVH